jgi:hypothetical protein
MDLYGPVVLTFGSINYRKLKQRQVNMLKQSFIEGGVQRYLAQNAIPVIMSRAFFEPTSVTQDGDLGEKAPKIEWTQAALKSGKVRAASGQHRVAAVASMRKTHDGIVDKAETHLMRIRGKAKSGEEMAGSRQEGSKVEEAEKELEAAEKARTEAGMWMIKIFEESK